MRIVTLYRHGLSMGTAPKKPNKNPPKRGTVSGWSEAATRRNTNFLRSVDERELPTSRDGTQLIAFALTLTIRDCPATSKDWERLRNAFFKRLVRMGLYRSHWVTEWQRRGVPHLHGAFWFPVPTSWDELRQITTLIQHWCDIASKYGASPNGQYVTEIHDAVGWFKYLAKHASRGVSHYQRSPENIPAAWKLQTGRVWGKTGDWPTVEKMKLSLEDSGFYLMRRLARNWRIADARRSGNRFRISSARKMLKHNDKDLSRLRGVSEWLPVDDSLKLLEVVASMGYSITHE